METTATNAEFVMLLIDNNTLNIEEPLAILYLEGIKFYEVESNDVEV